MPRLSAGSSLLRRGALDPLDDGRDALPPADAQGDERPLLIAPLELVQRGAEQHGAGCAERVPEGDRAAVDVDPGGVNLERANGLQHHRGEGFVDFPQIDVGRRKAAQGQRFA